MTNHRLAVAVLLLAAAGMQATACTQTQPGAGSGGDGSGGTAATQTAARGADGRGAAAIPVNDTPQDSAIFAERMALAAAERMDTLPLGEIVARIGRTFVGNPYVPGTLEAPGAEKLVVNLRVFDCVTFVENSLALARTIRARGDYRDYIAELARIRYRDGHIDGYPSRLHYFSDWIADNDRKGIVQNLTPSLGGIADPEPITFMTSHVASYRQLSDPAVVAEIRTAEERLTREGRVVIPEDRIAAVADRIRNGDVIAAATSVAGLDIAHTGIALWVDGELRLMHAPLVGSTVQISPNSLAARIKASTSQDGIMVARPQ